LAKLEGDFYAELSDIIRGYTPLILAFDGGI
jgi:hypothetical protein